MNELKPRVILISGPAGSGKTTTAQLISKNPGWILISEDEYWIEIKAGHPEGEARTPEEERIVQAKTLNKIIEYIEKGINVVIEFILYHSPPTPVIFYREELLSRKILVITRLLKASEDSIWLRKQKRGYSWDSNEIDQRSYARHQLNCLDSDYFKSDWIIDNTDLNENEVYKLVFRDSVN